MENDSTVQLRPSCFSKEAAELWVLYCLHRNLDLARINKRMGSLVPLVATHLAFHGAEMFFSSSLKMLLSDLMKFKPRLPPMTKREGNRSVLCQVFELSPPTELQSLE